MKHLIKISVEHAFRSATGNGWFVECSDDIDRFVQESDMLKHLGADAKGQIPCYSETWNYATDDIDQRDDNISFEEWMDLNAGLPLEIELAILINKIEGRTIAAPLPNGFDALNGIAHLVKSAA